MADKMQANFSENRKKIFFFGLLFVLGILLIIFSSSIQQHVLSEQLQLRPDTVIYQFWNTPPQPLYLDIYFFNWTNPEQFHNKSIKPNFKEIGPYRFQEYPSKENVSFHQSNHTVSYKKQSRYVFLPDQSKGRLDDVICSVNVVALSSANQARSWNILKVKGVEVSLKFFGQQIHLTKTADELLFKGYEDPIINVAREIAKIMGIDVPFDRFGWFYMRNESSLLTGDFNADTGVDDIRNVGKLRKWNFEPRTNFFDGHCGNLEGASAGELFPPYMPHDTQFISVFSPELCRNIFLRKVGLNEIEGVEGVKYVGDERTVDNGTKYSENACFCSGDCVPSGVINVTSCRLGAPVFMSFPHFYDADPYYLEQIEGMSPNKDKHQFSITLEPKTSLPLEIKGRFQLNVLMKPIKNINMYRDVQSKFMPVVWFEQRFKVDDNIAFLLKLAVNSDLLGQMIGFLTVLTSTLSIFFIMRKKAEEKLESQENKLRMIRLPLPEASPLISK